MKQASDQSSGRQWFAMADGTATPAPTSFGQRLQRSDTEVTTHDTGGLTLRRTQTHIQDSSSSSEEDSSRKNTQAESEVESKRAPERLIV